ncbi:MAG TPA: aminotransferase class IV [Solirubrobacterales bacterium]|nr:aminotransferase class IV [Solirubrobacterales bacterium]
MASSPPILDKARGLFETLLLFEGGPVELEAHLERLSASLLAVFGAELPPRLAEEAWERAYGIELGRMRIDVRPGDPGTAVTLSTEDVDPADFFPDSERGATLRAVSREGGLGPHKWADRRWLDGAAAGSVPLLLDRGEEVLEAGRANLFAAFEGVLVTPTADGRILPGIARAGAIATAGEAGIEVTERSLTRAELLAADEAFLTGSVRGVEPIATLDGAALPPTGEISRRVGDGLRQRWLGAPVAIAGPAPAAARPPDRPAR